MGPTTSLKFIFCRIFFFFCCLCSLHPRAALATRFFAEIGGGIAQIRGGSPFFEDDTPTPLGLGTALTFTLGADMISAPEAQTRVHFGIQNRFSTGSKDSKSYTFQAPYGFLRVDTRVLFITAGVAPYIWKRVNETAGLDAFSVAKSSLGIMGEIGLQWPITPMVSFGVTSAVQSALTGKTYSPKQIFDFTALLRFYIGGQTILEKERKSYGDGGPGEYEGFRYPYGFQK